MNCTICNVNKISSRGGKTCGLECACKAIGDDYTVVKARLDLAVAESKPPLKAVK
jgi:hypothetical protein